MTQQEQQQQLPPSLTVKEEVEEEEVPGMDAVLGASDAHAQHQFLGKVTKGAKLAVRGHDFNKTRRRRQQTGEDDAEEEEVDYEALFDSYATIGFQATHLSRAMSITNDMIDTFAANPEKNRIFLGYTSNMISSGIREVIRFLVQHRMVSVVVTTAGGIEEDFIKCLADTYVGDFRLQGQTLRTNGLNRIGNLLVPNDNYCKFENWLMPILDTMAREQKEDGVVWTPSKIIRRLGKEINDERSVYYWCYKNDIPVYCPALTDGSIGDMIYFHLYRTSGTELPNLVVDIAQDIRGINDAAVSAEKSGMIILGGGVVKHHIANANLMRNGADYSVFINTGQEFDGSDSGAAPDEAVSWGKIRAGPDNSVKVVSDATLVFPILVAQTFAKKVHLFKKNKVTEEEENGEARK